MTRFRHFAAVVLLLLLMFGLRGYQPALQVAYVDEGFHLRRALTIYDFEQNPARDAHGKLLLYFWTGLFDTDNPRTMLPVGRLAIALFSVISGAGIYLLGRIFANHRAGLIALTAYALMPLAFFYERLALADPLASALMVLVVWRSYAFARRPCYRQGVILGILIALATLAKLTMLLAVCFPVLAVLIYGHKKRGLNAILKLYVPPLIISGVLFCLIWSPFAVPAFFARNSAAPFVLVNARNVERTENDPASISVYVELLMPALGNFMLDDHTVRDFGIAGNTIDLPEVVRFHVIWIIIGLWFLTIPFSPRHHVYIGCWLIAITILLVSISSYVSARYFMPIAAPLALMIGLLLNPTIPAKLFMGQIYFRFYGVLRWISGGLFVGWLIVWVLPFITVALTEPETLPFDSTNWLEYQSGILTADHAVAVTAQIVNDLQTNEPIYASWNLCHRIFFLIEGDVICIPEHDTPGHLVHAVQSLADGATLLWLVSDYPPFYDEWDFVSATVLAENDHEILSRPIQIIRLQHNPQH